MRTRTALAGVLLIAMVPAAAEAADSHRSDCCSGKNSSRRLNQYDFSGSVNIVTNAGTGLYLGVVDDNGVFTSGVATHLLTPAPPGGAPALASSVAPGIGLMDIPSLWGIDHTSNIMGQTGGTGVRTMLSEQAATINPDFPRFASVEATTTSLHNQIITVTEHAAKREKKEDESTKHKEAAVAADYSRSYFNALTDSQIALSMTFEELSMLAEIYMPSTDDRSGLATIVTWAFGEGSVVGESTLFSDSMIFQIEANADNPVASLDLFDITVYDLTLSLSAGQQYWFSVDTYSYSVFVPAPSSALLAVLGFGLAARRRR